MTYINQKSVERTLSSLKSLYEERKNKPKEIVFDFTPFASYNSEAVIASVDGSHHNKSGNSLILSALRSGFQLYQNFKLIEEKYDDILVELLTPTLYESVYERYYQRVTFSSPSEKIGFEECTERIRTLLEWEKILYLLDKLSPGSVIVFDGSLLSGVIATNHRFFYEVIIKKASDHGISLVGLSKDTSIHINGLPIAPFLLSHAEHDYKKHSWFWEVDETLIPYKMKDIQTFFARFSGLTPLIFRVDTYTPNVKDTFQKLGSYCFQPSTLGYPFPMQNIHNKVLITRDHMTKIFQLIKDKCVDSDVSIGYIEGLFTNYHKRLEFISQGR